MIQRGLRPQKDDDGVDDAVGPTRPFGYRIRVMN